MTNDHHAEIRWQGSQWLRPHAIVAPFGIFLATVALYWAAAEKPFDRGDVRLAASLVDFGVVIYAMVAVSMETGVRAVFWALDQRRQWRARMREEAKAQGRAEARAATLAEMIVVKESGGDLEDWLHRAVATLEEDQP